MARNQALQPGAVWRRGEGEPASHTDCGPEGRKPRIAHAKPVSTYGRPSLLNRRQPLDADTDRVWIGSQKVGLDRRSAPYGRGKQAQAGSKPAREQIGANRQARRLAGGEDIVRAG